MIQAFLKTLKLCISKPWVFIPAVVANVLLLGISSVTLQYFQTLILDTLLQNTGVNLSLLDFAIFLLRSHPGEIAGLAAGILATTYLSLFLFYLYARFIREQSAGKNASLITAVKYTFGKLRELLYILIFFALVCVLLFTLYSLALTFTFGIVLINIALSLLVLLLIVYLAVKFLTLVPILSDGKSNLKNALKKSWDFSARNFYSSLGMLVIIAVYNVIADRLLDNFIAPSENVLFIASVLIVAYAVLTTVTLSYLCFFYFDRHKEEMAPAEYP